MGGCNVPIATTHTHTHIHRIISAITTIYICMYVCVPTLLITASISCAHAAVSAPVTVVPWALHATSTRCGWVGVCVLFKFENCVCNGGGAAGVIRDFRGEGYNTHKYTHCKPYLKLSRLNDEGENAGAALLVRAPLHGHGDAAGGE